MDLKSYVKDNTKTVAVASAGGATLGWLAANTLTGLVLGAALVPVVVVVGATWALDRAAKPPK